MRIQVERRLPCLCLATGHGLRARLLQPTILPQAFAEVEVDALAELPDVRHVDRSWRIPGVAARRPFQRVTSHPTSSDPARLVHYALGILRPFVTLPSCQCSLVRQHLADMPVDLQGSPSCRAKGPGAAPTPAQWTVEPSRFQHLNQQIEVGVVGRCRAIGSMFRRSCG
jgi:hypothetical protein